MRCNDRPSSPIAIDGPAASGKSTVGEALAKQLGFTFLDTGLMYRAFTLAALRIGLSAEDPDACGKFAEELSLRVIPGTRTRIEIGGEDITERLRDSEVEAKVSRYSAIPRVRAAMVSSQRALAQGAQIILAGRDIGTVVLPGAPLKLFLTASEDARAKRRGEQTGAEDDAQARHDISRRDRVDSTRAVSPLKPAPDAILIDTTDLSLAEVIDLALEYARCARS